jgi:hypothetical protein
MMKLEYLADGSLDCPLIRMYDFTPFEATQIKQKFESLASGQIERIDLHNLPEISTVGGLKFSLRVLAFDQGIVCTDSNSFECGFTRETWDNKAFLIEPFEKDIHGFQWLEGGEIKWLISPTGGW